MSEPTTLHLRNAENRMLDVKGLVVNYRTARGQTVHAVSDISFDLLKNETVGLVGESGCGKSTVGRSIMQLIKSTRGSVHLDGIEISEIASSKLRRIRPQMQMIFQDPISSLNPRRKVKHIVNEGRSIWPRDRPKTAQIEATNRMLEAVGLDPDLVRERRPHEFSGGQCQRISIARALGLEPKVLICDEPVSALDVSIQAQILNLLADLKTNFGLSLLFISHDLAVIKSISDRVIVMYMGKICEIGGVDSIFSTPQHHYTSLLLASIPHPNPHDRPEALPQFGETPSPINPPSGCRFRSRCPAATELCAVEEPLLRPIGHDHFVACHYPLETNVLNKARQKQQ